MPYSYSLEVLEGSRLLERDRAGIVRLCNEAYGEDVSHLFAAYTAEVHGLARVGNALVGYGMIVTRWLQAGDGPLLRTAYVELVATAANHRKRGIGSGIVSLLAERAARDGYDLAALCPADTGLYGYLGWEYWQGPLFIRPGKSPATNPAELIATPEERVMILRLPGTPTLELSRPLSAEWRAGGELW
jgi:GNAT superfamily N-acetyltransferase